MGLLDDKIDELAFGKAGPRTGPCLGLYLSPEVVYISDTHLEKGTIVVDHLVRIPVPPPEKGPATAATGSLNTDFLNDNGKLAALIKQSMGAIKWSSKEVVVTLSHHLGLLRYFTMPSIERRFWGAAVPLEAKKYIPIPFDLLSHDFQIVPVAPDQANKPRQGALMSVTQSQNIGNVKALLDALGLKMLSIEVAPCSVLRVWEGLDRTRQGRTHCQVHLDGGSIRILLADKGIPVFFRELFLGPEAQISDLRKIDLPGCVSFAQKQLGVGPVSQMFVSGNVPNLAEWQEAFSRELGVAAAALEMPQRLGIKGGDWGGYSSIGASLRHLTPSPVAIDLAQIGKITDDEHRTARAVLVAAGAIALFFAGRGIYWNMTYSFQARELNQYKPDPEIQAVFSGKSPDEVTQLLQRMQDQIKAIDAVVNEPIKPTLLLKEMIDAMPPNIWLTNIQLRSPMDPKEPLALMVSGHVKGNSPGAEQELALQFKEALRRTPNFGKVFSEIQAEVKLVEPANPDNSEESRRSVEERTRFQFTMTRKI
jgi:hypothetical protein